MSIKQLEALTMHDIGYSKTFIRKKLNVKVKRLNKWIKNDNFDTKERAIRLYFMNIPLEIISSKLNITDLELNNWINIVHQNLIIPKEFKSTIIKIRQNGYSSWIDTVVETSEKVNLLNKIRCKVNEIAKCS